MARFLSTTQGALNISSRSWRVQIFTELERNGDYVCEFFRETVHQPDGMPPVSVNRSMSPISVPLSHLAPKVVTLSGGLQLTGLQVAEAVALIGDLLEEEQEIQSEEPPAEEPEAP